VECNLISHESVSSTIRRVVEQGLDFDILVNCGGITYRAAPEEFPDDRWNDVSYFLLNNSNDRYYKSI
jgi:NAD(P)-dependent dehydrogenase (short-subunit alcohol dehydrogenase family)